MNIRKTILISAVSGLMLFPAPAFASQEDPAELEYGEGQKIYVVLPDDYDPGQHYPCVYFMPQDGYSAREYLDDGTIDVVRELQSDGRIGEMICAFVQYRNGTDLFEQTSEAIEAVENEYPAVSDASQRGIIGTGVGGYMAYLLGYSGPDGQLQEEPLYFSAIASHDGDFASEDNPFLQAYGSVYGLLKEPVSSSGADTQWISSYYAYIDFDLGNANALEDGGSADIAYAFRSPGLSCQDSPQAWDYSVFEYAVQDQVQYGRWTDHLERSLKGFSEAFIRDGNEPARSDETETEYTAKETVASGEDRMIDLMGDWYFRTADAIQEQDAQADVSDIDDVLGCDWKSWDVVQPGFGWWTEDFASCLKGNPYYAGYAWYIREFDVPEEFDTSSLQIDAGMVDEGDEAYINGVRAGQTGIPDEGGSYNGTNPWDEERIYEIPDGLIKAGKNTIAVRVCNGSGAGGWYTGPIQIEARKEPAGDPGKSGQRYYTTSFKSDALKGQEIEYRVYLPVGYYESDLRYPVVYMLHGYGSTGKSFEIAGVPELLDEGISEGDIPLCIMIFPSDGHPQKAGWWSGAYAKMLNEDLVREVDSTLRTVGSRDYRFLAGESMGGGGAYLNALNNPDLYGGVLDMYGALRYTGALKTFLDMDAEELGAFRHYIICGTHDMYCFDLDHIMMGRHLAGLGIPYRLDIDSGEHSSEFYLPRLKAALAYLLESAEPVDSSGHVITETEG